MTYMHHIYNFLNDDKSLALKFVFTYKKFRYVQDYGVSLGETALASSSENILYGSMKISKALSKSLSVHKQSHPLEIHFRLLFTFRE